MVVLLLVWEFKAFMQDVNVLTPQKLSDTHIVSTRTLMTQSTANSVKINTMLQKGIQELFAKKTDLAIQDLTEVVKQDPKNTAALNDLGICYQQQKNWTKSNAYFEKALSINPHYALGHYNLALSYCQMGNFQSAIQEYKTLRAYGPIYVSHLILAFHKHCPALKLSPALAKLPPNGIALMKNSTFKVPGSAKK